MPQHLEAGSIDETSFHRPCIDVSIIIVNWNSIDYLRECIASILKHTRNVSFEIIVVDNASPAGDASLLEPQSPPVSVIKSAVNLGFAGANNLGFRQSSGRYLLFLNPDTKIVGPAISVMVDCMRSIPGVGILGCKLLNSDLSVQTSCIQTFPTILNQVLDSDWLREYWPNSRLWGTAPLFSDSSKPARVEVVSGACMLVRRDIFQQVGLFGEDYFMYAEDLDLCYRVADAGYGNYYVGTAEVIHYGGKSSNPRSATQMKWRSISQFCEKHHGKSYALAFRTIMALAAIGRLTILHFVGLFGRAPATQLPKDASTKWKLILKTLVAP